MRVAERMTEHLISCAAADSLATAARLLLDEDCDCVPVVDHGGRVRGMLTDRDICMAAFKTGRSLAELRVRDAMAKDVASTRPSASLAAAVMVMRSRGICQLPVLDAQNRMIGLLRCNDLLSWVDDGDAHGGGEPATPMAAPAAAPHCAQS
ncbi:MAG TPA: CBS domain-containing protein [Planctomycetota bacterium]|nr:CBS domain-containing protein [Planctomycetota bacterium]